MPVTFDMVEAACRAYHGIAWDKALENPTRGKWVGSQRRVMRAAVVAAVTKIENRT